VAALAFLLGCGGGEGGKSPEGRAIGANGTGAAPGFATDDAGFRRFRSKRFALSFPLPDGKVWKIDDRTGPSLVATHASTTSTLTVAVTRETELVNRSMCEARAREMGWLAGEGRKPAVLTTVEEHVQTGPGAYDSKVWVALQTDKPGGAVAGHIFLFGGFLRQCLLVHYRTEVPSSRDEDAIAARLAVVRTRVLGGLELDPMRVTDEAEVPRTKPNVTR
jgi:hypothetical protein